MMFEVKNKVKDKDIASLLISALEGGSNYWCTIVEIKKPPLVTFRCDEKNIYAHIDFPMSIGGSLWITPTHSNMRYKLDLKAIQKGIQIMCDKYHKHWSDFINDNADSITGDVFLQCCLFEQVIYS